jgi:hypothetical protein
MKAFRFRLERVLEWRRLQLEMEENRLQLQMAALAELDRTGAELEAAAIGAELQVRAWSPLSGRDLGSLSGFRRYVQNEERTLAERRARSQRELGEQEAAMLEARRRCRLLERLRERQWAEWQATGDRELEQFATESYLAGTIRRRR